MSDSNCGTTRWLTFLAGEGGMDAAEVEKAQAALALLKDLKNLRPANEALTDRVREMELSKERAASQLKRLDEKIAETEKRSTSMGENLSRGKEALERAKKRIAYYEKIDPEAMFAELNELKDANKGMKAVIDGIEVEREESRQRIETLAGALKDQIEFTTEVYELAEKIGARDPRLDTIAADVEKREELAKEAIGEDDD